MKHIYIGSRRIAYAGSNDDYVNGRASAVDDATGLRAGNDNQELFQYYYHSDHLGSTSLITDLDGNVVQHVEYVPFGEVFIEERNNKWNTPYLFNATELDEETGLYYYGARYYDARVSLWLGADPMQERYPNISTYEYCANNPIKYIDPDGKFVSIVFDKSKGTLLVVDLDNYDEKLQTIFVNAAAYTQGGIKNDNGELLFNQVLIIENVFSGGKVNTETNQPERDVSDGRQTAIPNGTYDLLEYEKHDRYFKLDPRDSSPYDDKHQGYTNSSGETRNGYRLHLGGTSFGCITINSVNQERSEEWNVLSEIIKSTSNQQVPKREGSQKFIPFTSRTQYGVVTVKGEDNVPLKQNENTNP
jgi:RHS repeat-associated protein